MNEEELKTLWQNPESTPEINFARLQKLSDDGYRKLRRKAKIDVWAQTITAVACLIPVYFYPRLIFAAVLALILGIWYARELRGLYKNGPIDIEKTSVSDSIKARIRYLKSFFWRARIAVYLFLPLTLAATYYGLGYFDNSAVSLERALIWLAIMIIIGEVLVVIFCEIYFLILYKPALRELNEISRQLVSE